MLPLCILRLGDMEWICCLRCHKRKVQDTPFYVSDCGHIICEKCRSQAGEHVCNVILFPLHSLADQTLTLTLVLCSKLSVLCSSYQLNSMQEDCPGVGNHHHHQVTSLLHTYLTPHQTSSSAFWTEMDHHTRATV